MFFLAFFVLPLSFILFYKASGTMALNRLNMLSIVFYYNLLFGAFVGSFIISQGEGNNSVIQRVSDDTRQLGYLWVLYVMVAMPIGMNMARIIMGIKSAKKLFNNYSFSIIKPVFSQRESYFRYGLYFLSGLSYLSAIYVTITNGGIPQLAFFHNVSHGDLLAIRVSLSRSFPGIIYIKTIFFDQLPFVTLFASFALYLKTRSKKDLTLFIILLILCIYSSTFLLSKGPIVGVFIKLFLLYILYKGKVRVKHLFTIFFSLFLLLILMFKVVSNYPIDKLLSYLVSRIFIDQVSGMFLMLEIFPRNIDHIGFQSISSALSSIFGLAYTQPATRQAMEYAFPLAVELGQMNLLSTLFLGEAWANFGYFGAIIAPIHVGFVLGLFYYNILTRKKTPFNLAILAYFSWGLSVSSQYNAYIYNSLAWSLLTVFSFSYIIAIVLKSSKKKLYLSKK